MVYINKYIKANHVARMSLRHAIPVSVIMLLGWVYVTPSLSQ